MVKVLFEYVADRCCNYPRYQVNNIRELLGHKVDLNFIETNPAVRLERD